MHRQLRIRTLFSGGAHSDADTAVFSTFGKSLTARSLYIIARTKTFFRLTEEPFLCCGKGSSNMLYVLFRQAKRAFRQCHTGSFAVRRQRFYKGECCKPLCVNVMRKVLKNGVFAPEVLT